MTPQNSWLCRQLKYLLSKEKIEYSIADHGERAGEDVGLRPLACRDGGFESRLVQRCLYVFDCCALSGRGVCDQWRTQEFCSWGGVQQIQLRIEDRENGDLGAVAP